MLIAVALALGAAVLGFFVGRDTKHPRASAAVTVQASGTVDPHVAAGAHIFVQFACAQCHGPQGQGGVSPTVPTLTKAGSQLTATQLRQIINHGLGESANPTRPYMPVWGAVISDSQVNDLVSYIRAGLPAVATATPPEVPQALIDQLTRGGRLVAPVGRAWRLQELVVIEKTASGEIRRRAVSGVTFVPMVHGGEGKR